MYTVYADDNLLYHPSLVGSGRAIFDAELVLEANKSGSFRFKMPVTNIMYNQLTKMSTIITVYDNSEEIFRGRILNDERDFNNTKLVYCEGELAFLLDSIVKGYESVPVGDDPSNPDPNATTIASFFTDLITNHNNQMESKKQFEVGQVTVLANTNINVTFTDYASTWNVFNTYLLDQYGGYVRIRLSEGHRYIDYISSYGNTNTQPIVFGENMLDLTQYISAEDLFTVLIPLGATYAEELDDSAVETGQILNKETEPVKNKSQDPTTSVLSAPTYVFRLEVIRNSKSKETEKTNITVNYYVKTTSGSSSWSGKDGTKLYADISFDTGLPDPQDTEKTVKVEQKTALTSGNFTTTEQRLVTWTGDVATKNLVITGEFINQYTEKDSKPISNSMAVVVQLLEQKYLKTTINSVNNNKDYLQDIDAETTQARNLFGNILAVHEWPDVDDPTELKTLGEQYLKDNVSLAVKLELNAVDLHELNVAYEKFKIGDRVKVLSAPHGLTDSSENNVFTVTKITLDLQNPDNNVYSLGSEFKSLTETQVTAAKDINITNDIIEQIINDLGKIDDIVQEITDYVNTIYDQYADVTTVINNLDAAYADIDFANISTAAIENLFANQAVIDTLNANYLQANAANITDATIENLVAGNIDVDGLDAHLATIDLLNVQDASITNLLARQAVVNYLSAEYADIDLANISQAAINNLSTNFLYANAANITQATIGNLIAGTATVQGLNASLADINFGNITTTAIQNALVQTGLFSSLTIQNDAVVGGTLNANSIAAGSIVADKLILRGTDGLYYELNMTKKAELEEGKTPEEQAEIEAEWAAIPANDLKNSLHGENIIAETVTAKQIAAGTITAQKLATLDASQVTFQNGQTQTTMAGIISDVSGLTSTVSTLSGKVDSSVKSYVYKYGYGTSETTHPSDSVFTYDTMPAKVDGQYIWRRTTITKNDNTSSKSYEMIQGADGESGNSITSAETLYYLQQNTLPTAVVSLSDIEMSMDSGGTRVSPTVNVNLPIGTYHAVWEMQGSTLITDAFAGFNVPVSGGSTSMQSVSLLNSHYEADIDLTTVSGVTGDPVLSITFYISNVTSNRGTTLTVNSFNMYSESAWNNYKTAPAKPTVEIVNFSDLPNTWSLKPPVYSGTGYYYTCMQFHYDDNTITWSNPVPENELDDVYFEITKNSSQIIQTNNLIETRVGEIDEVINGEKGIEYRLSQTESFITQNSDSISMMVTTQDIDGYVSDGITDALGENGSIKTYLTNNYINIRDSGVTIVSAIFGSDAAKETLTSQTGIDTIKTQIAPLATAFQVKSTGTYVYRASSIDSTTGEVIIDEANYLRTYDKGMEIYISGYSYPRTWVDADGGGMPSLSIGDNPSGSARWQFRRSNGLLNISWHS